MELPQDTIKPVLLDQRAIPAPGDWLFNRSHIINQREPPFIIFPVLGAGWSSRSPSPSEIDTSKGLAAVVTVAEHVRTVNSSNQGNVAVGRGLLFVLRLILWKVVLVTKQCHPSIFCHLSRLWGEDFLLLSHLLQLFQRNIKVFPRQSRDLISPLYPGSSLGVLPANLAQNTSSRRNPGHVRCQNDLSESPALEGNIPTASISHLILCVTAHGAIGDNRNVD